MLRESVSNGDMSIITLFHDTSCSFTRYLELRKVDPLADRIGLIHRSVHSVVPHRIGARLQDHPNCIPGARATVDDIYYLSLANHTFFDRYIEWTPKNLYRAPQSAVFGTSDLISQSLQGKLISQSENVKLQTWRRGLFHLVMLQKK